ncbi:heavy metal-associated isoprenylated plant protein 39 [Henckelia pumila]|uniref:heavy metal-associated isoprenylated plant protein 39 n=1 Tax=Henckelia pumila TaxID=405737 RepID=UPI003C6E199E
MAQKVVLKVLTMTDEKTKQKAIEAAADIFGVDSIAADLKDQKLTVIGEMDAVAVVKKLKKVGKVDIVSVGPAKEEKKEEAKKPEEKKEEKKDEKKEDTKEEKKEDKKPEEKK